MHRTRIKICGIRRVEDALFAAQAGADAIGLIVHAASPRSVSLEDAIAIRAVLPPFVSVVALVVNADRPAIDRIVREVRPNLLQFHGDETADFCASFPIAYLKAMGVATGTAAADLLKWQQQYSTAAALLLDTSKDGKSGGTGTVFDWSLIPAEMRSRVVLAGGLNPGNVGTAVRAVRPWAVDVSSGVEAEMGRKDHAKIAAFIDQVRQADANV
ncbi:MAG: phosphoribosylanthranilate isomerase [Betaproteobacteria bacterium]|nr:phosphoribosylanthranilate isomerase [Betaproteobacteria bacterium]